MTTETLSAAAVTFSTATVPSRSRCLDALLAAVPHPVAVVVVDQGDAARTTPAVTAARPQSQAAT